MRAVGIILAGGNNSRMKELSRKRAVGAMPIAGSYRAIDFALSNMANSHIQKVAILTQYNARSLNEHLSSSKWWDFGRKQGGLYVFTPTITAENSNWYRGTADALYQNLHFLKRSHEPYVVLASGDGIYKLDYNKILEYHIQKRADITVVCKEMPEGEDLSRFGQVKADDDGRIRGYEEKPMIETSRNVSCGIYVIRRRLLIELIERAAEEDRYDLVKDILIRYKDIKRIYAYQLETYWNNISSVEAYYRTNMDFLNKDVRKILTQEPFIASKPSDDPPAKYNPTAEVTNTLVGTGSIIDGNVKNSVLFRKVFVGEGATVENSVIMKSSYIGKGCVIKNAIIDKEVVISDNKEVIGTEEEPIVIGKGQVI